MPTTTGALFTNNLSDDKFYTTLSAYTIMAKLTNQFQRTKLITSSPDKHYSLDSENDFCSGFQNYHHPDDHIIQLTISLDKLQ